MTAEELQEAMDDVYYNLTCDICDEPASKSLLLRDFELDSSSMSRLYIQSIADAIRSHNMTHMEA